MLTQMSGGQTPKLLLKHSKLPQDKLAKIESIADSSLEGVAASSAAPLVMGIAVGCTVGAFSSMPIVGGLAGAFFIYNAISTMLTKGRQSQYVIDTGCVAHILPESKLIEYTELVGLKDAVAEIKAAYLDGEQVSVAARKLVEASGDTLKRRSVSNFMAEIKQLQEIPTESLPTVSSILKSAEVTEAPTFTPPSVASPQASHAFTDVRPQDDYLAQFYEITDRDNSLFIVGSKGSGKGMCTANVLRRKLEQYPNAVALVLDPKGDKKEDGYWQHDRIIRRSFEGSKSSSQVWAKNVTQFIKEAYEFIDKVDVKQGKRLFLVFDEFWALKNNCPTPVFNEIKKFCSNSISLGDSQGIHAFLITQSFNAGDSVESEELLKNLCLVGVFSRDEYDRAAKIVRLGKTNSNKYTSGDFLAMIDDSPVNRVFCVGGVFMPAPRLINYSGYDRDSGETVDAPQKTETVSETPSNENVVIVGKFLARQLDQIKADNPAALAVIAKQRVCLQSGSKREAIAIMLQFLYPDRSQFAAAVEPELLGIYDWAMAMVVA